MGQNSTDLGTEFMVTITSTRVAGHKTEFSSTHPQPAVGARGTGEADGPRRDPRAGRSNVEARGGGGSVVRQK